MELPFPKVFITLSISGIYISFLMRNVNDILFLGEVREMEGI